MFESRISAAGSEKLPFPQNLRISAWTYDMAGHAKKFVERYCELANKTTQQLYKVSTPCIDDHHFKEEETKSVGELSQVCSKIVLKCWYLARIGKPDVLLSEQTCTIDYEMDQGLWNAWIDWYPTFIIHVTTNSIAMCVILSNNTSWDCFQTLILREMLRIQNPLLEEHCAFWESHTFVPISWMCKIQTSVSHSSTESEIISLDAGDWD